MNALRQAIARFLRGPSVARLLKGLGIDPARYWLLMDLFGQISERREMLTQLGRGDGMALKSAASIYFLFSGLLSVLSLLGRPSVMTYMWTLLLMTAFILLSVLIAETSNSLVNPVEGLVLAHQPVNGATYTAAKLSHLALILLYLVPGLNAIPALAGLFLKQSIWYYPFAHMLAAFAVGLAVALCCCAVFGWLIRFVPPPRLKAAGQMAEMVPWLAFLLAQYVRGALARVHISAWLPDGAGPRGCAIAALCIVAAAVVVLGLRSLSGDYLVRVSSIAHGGSRAAAKIRGSRMGAAVARFLGPAGRAGFDYVSRMMVRDWQFRRQLIPIAISMVLGPAVLIAQSVRTSPFSGRFSMMHLLPHIFGIVLLFVCTLLPYGGDYKGAWMFLLAPAEAFRPFARGIHAALWLKAIALPHAAVLCVLAWYWGIRDAGLFTAYSVAVASLYLALEVRLIDGVPFAKQPEASRNAFIFPMMVVCGIAMGAAVALQHFLVFRSHAIVTLTTLGVAAAACLLTRRSLSAFEISMRYSLGLLSGESQVLYKEVG